MDSQGDQPLRGFSNVFLDVWRRKNTWSRATDSSQYDIVDRLFLVGVIGLAATVGVILFVSADANPDLLWRGYYHDRNAHYAVGQAFALAVITADPAWFLDEILKAQIWPPVHGLVLSAVLLVGGIDHRLGIVPSLLGWALTVIFAALIARRMFRDRDLGIVAAVIAVTLGVASPAFRLLASDVMLECLGAGLSAAALWAYGRAESPGNLGDSVSVVTRWRLLAVILTLLFFEKGNYWGLVLAALAVTHVLSDATGNLGRLLATLRRIQSQFNIGLIFAACCDPFIVVTALLSGLVIYLYERGPMSIAPFGKSISLYPPENLVTITYAVLFARCALWWFKRGPGRDTALGPAGRALFYWHLVPVAVSFLFPHRLSAFIGFVGPSNAATGFNLGEGVLIYWRAFVDGFSAGPWSAILTLGLSAVGLTQVRRFSPGGRAAFALALVGFAGVVIHPQHQGRFLGSWLFAVWICAGGGGAVLVEWLIPRRAWLIAAGTLGIMIASMTWRAAPPSAYPVAIYPASGPSDLDLFRPVLPEIKGLRSVGYATTFGQSDLLSWMAREDCRCKMQIENPWLGGVSRSQIRNQMAGLLASSGAEAFVMVDAPSRYYELPFLGWAYDNMTGILDAFAAQSRYVGVSSHEVPQFGAVVSVWRWNTPSDRKSN